MKKYIFFISLALILSSPVVFAEDAVTPTSTVRELRQKVVEDRKIFRQEVKEKIKEKRQNFVEEIKNKLGQILRFGARKTGELTAINGNTLTLKANDGKSYQINVLDNTQLRRRFGGKSELSEFSVGDKINVVGKWTDANKTAIDTKLIRNASIQKLFGAFLGKITAKNSDNFILQTVNRGSQTVYINGAEFTDIKGNVISYDDVQVGQRVRVKGTWDRKLNKITDVKEVKDFDLPVKLIPTPTTSQ